MRCRSCGKGSKVIDVQKTVESVRRRRECTHCGDRWNTLEQVLGVAMPQPAKPAPEVAKKVDAAKHNKALHSLAEIFDEDLDDIMKELGI